MRVLLSAVAAAAIVLATAASPAAARTCDGVGYEPPGGDGGWGAYKLSASNVSCATARRLTYACWRTGVEPRGWTFLSLSPPGVQYRLVRRSQGIAMEMAGGGSDGCEGRGRYCARSFVIPNDDYARIYARGVRCATAKQVYLLWNNAGSPRPKDRPGRGWTCASRGTAGTDHVIGVRCERGRAFVRWVY